MFFCGNVSLFSKKIWIYQKKCVSLRPQKYDNVASPTVTK